MKILAVDTAEQSCSIALVEDQIPLCETFFLNKRTHSRSLMDMIVHMLEKRAGLNIHEIDGFVAAHGPGSFTGLRIGISVVKGLACAVSKPAAGISSLDGIAWQFSTSTSVCAMMDAKRGEVYCAFYHFENGLLVEKSQERAIAPEKAAKMAKAAGKGNTLFAGSGAAVFRNKIQHFYGAGAHFVLPFQNYVRASALAHVLFQDPAVLSLNHDAVKPLYLRRSDAEITYDKHHK